MCVRYRYRCRYIDICNCVCATYMYDISDHQHVLYYCYIFFITFVHELLCTCKNTNIYYNAMIGTSKYKIESNESPIRTERICKYM